MRGIYGDVGAIKHQQFEVQGDRLRLSLLGDALPTKFGPDLKRATGNLAQAQLAEMKLYSTRALANKADEAKATPQYVRQVPRHKLVVTCFIGEVDSKSNCSTKCFGEDGVPNQSGKMTCGFPGDVAEIEWKFLGYSGDKDVYEFTVVAPRGSPDANTTKTEVEFAGRRMPVLRDSNRVIVLDSLETKAQGSPPEQPAEPQPKTENAAPQRVRQFQIDKNVELIITRPDVAKQNWCLKLLEDESNPAPLRSALTALNQIGGEGQEPRLAKATLHALGRMYDQSINLNHDDDLTGSREESIMELVEQLTAALVKQPSDVVVEAILSVAQEKTRSLGSRFALLTVLGDVLDDKRRGDVEAPFGHLRKLVAERADQFVKVLVDTRKDRQDPEGPAFVSALHVVKISKRKIADFEGLEPFITQQLARGSFRMGADHAFAEFLLDIDPNYPGLIDFMLRLLRNVERDFDHSDLTPMFPRFGEKAKLFVPELVKMLQMRSKQAFGAGTSQQVFIQGGKVKQLAEALGSLGLIAKDALPLLREISATPLPTEGVFSEANKTKYQRQYEQSVMIVKTLKVAADKAIDQINEAPKSTN